MADNDRGPQLLAVNFLFLAMAVAATVLRCYTRMFVVKSFGTDDYFMILAAGLFIIYISFSQNGVYHGTGQHNDDVEPGNRVNAIRSWFFCELFYAAVMITSKISIGFFLLRVTVKRIHGYIIYGAVSLSIVAGLAFFFVVLFQCNPVSDYWMKYVGEQVGTCLNVEIVIALAYLYSACSIVSDFTLALLPVFLIKSLNMDRRTKILLVPLLGMGTIASAALAVRCPYILTFRDPDFLWATLDIAIWSSVEQGLAITAGSLATTRPLLRRVFEKLGISRPSVPQISGPDRRPDGSNQSEPAHDTYKLSHIMKGSKNDWSRRDSDEDAVIDGAYGVQTNISAGKTGSVAQNPQFIESQEELRGETSNVDVPGNGAVVARSFLVTSEKR